MLFQVSITFLLLGVFAGTLAGIFGIGGGLVIVPILHFAFKGLGFPEDHLMHLCVGTSLSTIFITGMNSVHTHHRLKNIDWSIVKLMTPTVLLGTFIGGKLSGIISGDVLEKIFFVYVVVVSIKMWIDSRVESTSKETKKWLYSLFGLIIGIKSPLLGIGGGTISIPFLTWRGFKMQHAVGVSAALGLPIAFMGSLMAIYNGQGKVLPEYALGFVYWPAVLGIGLTSSFFARIGAKMSQQFPQDKMRKGFALFLIAIAVKSFLTN